jgi:hypothetical protein
LADEKGRCPLITNLKSMSYEEVIKAYEARNPSTWHDLTPVIYNLKELMDNQSQWLTQRLKERALMFFPSGFSLNALEETLGLPGTEAFNAAEIQIQLQISEEFKYREELKVAIENINNLYIKDNRARKLSILV